jgi:hypothetical protein
MKFFFSSKQECMPNTIQSVFLSVTHVFVSILKLFLKIWLSKMYPYFKLLIFGYKSIFDEIFDPLRVFLGAEYESAFIFCPRPQEYGQKMIYKEVPHTRYKPRFYGFDPL